MRTAEESRELSKDHLRRVVDESLREINKEIDNAINLGKFSISYYDNISDEMLNRLSGLGYKVADYSSQKDGYYYIISWH